MAEIPPGGGAETGPYDEAALDAEVAAHIPYLQTEYDKALQRGDAISIRNAKSQLDYASEGPMQAFLSFQNNFYGKLPGGLTRQIIESLSQGFGEEAELPQSFKDVDVVLKEIGATSELVARAADKKTNLDAEAVSLLRKVYIAMRNRGYAHKELHA